MPTKVRYQKVPVYSFVDDLPPVDEKKKWRACIAQLSERCYKQVLSTSDSRICSLCKPIVNRGKEKK